jgi:hypothetical protein
LKQNPSWEMCSWKIEEKDNIKMDLKQDRLWKWEGSQLTPGRAQWQTLQLLNLQVLLPVLVERVSIGAVTYWQAYQSDIFSWYYRLYTQGVPKRYIHKVNIPYYNVYSLHLFGIPVYSPVISAPQWCTVQGPLMLVLRRQMKIKLLIT